jgi:hypothetical protein
MARLPTPGSDNGTWGAVLNDFLVQTHTSTGQLKSDAVGSSQLQAGAVTQAKLDASIQAQLDSAGVSSVNTRTGDITLSKTDVDLANVDNTNDLNKPVSTAVQAALDTKADAADVGAKVLLINTAADLPAGTPAGVIVVVKS